MFVACEAPAVCHAARANPHLLRVPTGLLEALHCGTGLSDCAGAADHLQAESRSLHAKGCDTATAESWPGMV